jgi:uncharacterized protein YecE (DUF72 family)
MSGPRLPGSGRAIVVGTAGWSIPKADQEAFAAGGSHLVRYASRFHGVEINSSFYRPHRISTYQRWAGDVPDGFRFAVKMPKTITHEGRLVDRDRNLPQFLGEIAGLGEKLGPVLVQLPPSLAFDPAIAPSFFRDLRAAFDGDVVCEPRHATWFTPAVDASLAGWRVARVASDPRPHPVAAKPGGWQGLAYIRLHGSPKMCYSAYSDDSLAAVADDLARQQAAGGRAWCIFDNTAAFAATANALSTAARVAPDPCAIPD